MEKKFLEIINRAITREEEAYLFYMNIHGKVEDPNVKDTILWIAGEEKKHKEFLLNYRDGKYGAKPLRMTEVVLFKIAEYQEEPEIARNMRSEDVYLVASHRELRSYQFYSELAQIHPDGEAKDLLQKMANEELRHKEKMEYLYSNTAFAQTSGG